MENNDQNSSTQVNQNNNVNQQVSNNNKLVIALMALIIVGLVGYIVYTKFIQKNDNSEPKPNNTQEQENNNQNENSTNTNENNNQNENSTNTNENNNLDDATQFTKVELSSNNKEISFGNSVLSIKSSDNSLYVNNNKIYTSEWEDGTHLGFNIYTNNKSNLILIEDTYENICDDGLIVGAINSNGELLDIESKDLSNHPDLPACREKIYIKNNKIYGIYGGEDIANETDFSYEVEFIIK